MANLPDLSLLGCVPCGVRLPRFDLAALQRVDPLQRTRLKEGLALGPTDRDVCAICTAPLNGPPPAYIGTSTAVVAAITQEQSCGHVFHFDCLMGLYAQQKRQPSSPQSGRAFVDPESRDRRVVDTVGAIGIINCPKCGKPIQPEEWLTDEVFDVDRADDELGALERPSNQRALRESWRDAHSSALARKMLKRKAAKDEISPGIVKRLWRGFMLAKPKWWS
mgnify:CR=1 FL=1